MENTNSRQSEKIDANSLPKGWFPITEIPPDTLLKVIDIDGRKGFAYPTYLPFKIGKPIGGKWTSPLTPCEPYWDGGWLISVPHGKLTTELKAIVGWRHF